MEDTENLRFETLKTPLTTGIKERGNEPADNIAGAGSAPHATPDPDASKEDARAAIIRRVELEIEITDDRPTAAERKAVEDFFDWLLAEALRCAGEVDKAA
jgi:hypothetical protein